MQRPGVPESKVIQSVDDQGMWGTLVECFNKGYLIGVCSEGIPGSAPTQGADEAAAPAPRRGAAATGGALP